MTHRALALRLRTPQMMWFVVAALLPGAAAMVYAWTPAVLAQLAAGVAAAMAADRAMLALRGNPPGEGALDGSAAVAGAIVGLSVAPLAPLWVAASAAAFGVCLAKHCYGGLGANLFNPAMVGYAFAYAAFPGEFAAWPADGLPPSASAGALLGGERIDAVAGPTVLQASAGEIPAAHVAPPALFALGGILLVALRVADWRLAASYLLGVALAALFADPGGWDRLGAHLLAGGTALAAFFVLTDPVTAPKRAGCRAAYALLAGILTVVVRVWGSHPDGIAFAVLFVNMLAPAMDRLAGALARRRG